MLRLELPSTPECGTLVRALLTGLGAALAWDDELVDDLKMAATEACNNVVLHAYGSEVGKLVLRLDALAEWLEIVVCDEGEGLHGVAPGDDQLHVGLPVISSLAERAEFLSPSAGGTEVRMFFRIDAGASPLDTGRERGPDQRVVDHMLQSWTTESVADLLGDEPLLVGDVVGVVSPAALLGPAMGRLVRALAAGNHFRIDRFSKLRELTDTLGAHARAAARDHRVGFALMPRERRLELAAGPFAAGSGTVFTPDTTVGPASPLRELADDLTIEHGQSGEIVRLLISDPR